MYKLKYFNARGAGEIIRLLFASAKVSFEDIRFPMDMTTYARPEFEAAKAAGEFDANLGSVPVLIYTEGGVSTTIGQSKTIERFVARKLDLLGSNEVEAARIDSIGEHVRDIKQKYNDFKRGKKDAELETAKDNFIKVELPKLSALMEKCLDANGYAIGSKLSLADISLFNLYKDYFDDVAGAIAAIEQCPNIQSAVNNATSAVADYLSTRVFTKF